MDFTYAGDIITHTFISDPLVSATRGESGLLVRIQSSPDRLSMKTISERSSSPLSASQN
jgi:hypothetical protein